MTIHDLSLAAAALARGIVEMRDKMDDGPARGMVADAARFVLESKSCLTIAHHITYPPIDTTA